jgi:lysophospholipase L1-like esterase
MNDVFAQPAGPILGGAKYVVIMAGTNDVCTSTSGQMTSVSAFTTQLGAALTRLTTNLPSARILVASIPAGSRCGSSSTSPRRP